jgi:hypothetical protein
MTRFRLTWVSSTGGPLIVLPKAACRTWSGIEPSREPGATARFRWGDPSDPPSDYDRACDVTGRVAVLGSGASSALVLGDMPLMTTWWPLVAGGYFVRWVYADSEADALRGLSSVPARSFRSDRVTFRFDSGPLLLFDSSVPGAWLTRRGGPKPTIDTIDLPPGEYRVSTCVYNPDEQTQLVLHRLAPAPRRSRSGKRAPT